MTINKINKDTKKDSEKLKTENNSLKTTLEITRQNEQKLKKLLSEREALIEELSKKSEELESAIKNATSKSAGATYDVASIVTEPSIFDFKITILIPSSVRNIPSRNNGRNIKKSKTKCRIFETRICIESFT